ncbi:integral membrane protein [Aspergillus bertholletiae]|uniref:Integral membrane protein n=1 Tax=Aspergillus bertholletiae TaxID=1226010 RepID=A0A5N7BHU8_9EURO|nr:integral membrane protein [Aspergillus bertholletiae]
MTLETPFQELACMDSGETNNSKPETYRAIKIFLLSLCLWLLIFEYCRFALWRDPHSAFFDDSHVYDLQYSLYRERESRHFISRYNSPSDPLAYAKSGPEPLICAAFVTVRRNQDDSFDPSIGSLLEGLDTRERQALQLKVLFADTDPTRHPSWEQRWVDRLIDDAGSYNVSQETLDHLRRLETERNFYEKGIYLHLFYTETALGWSSSDFTYRNMPFIFLLNMFCIFSCLVQLRRWRFAYYLDYPSVFVICLICVPAFTGLIYTMGKYIIMPLRGIVEMNKFGCCTQALVFPKAQVDGVMGYLTERGHGQIDSMIKEYADQRGLTRYALALPVLQHVGLKSIRDNLDINTRSTWAFWFEDNDPKVLQVEHERLLSDSDVLRFLSRLD